MPDKLDRRAAMALIPALAVVALPSSASAAQTASPGLQPHTASAWEQKRAAFLAALEADRADTRTGALRSAYDLDEQRREKLFAEYGGEAATRADPVGDARLKAIFAETAAAEERHYERFSRRRWDAFDELIETRPPTIAALREKLRITSEEGAPEGEDVVNFVLRDLVHLFGEA